MRRILIAAMLLTVLFGAGLAAADPSSELTYAEKAAVYQYNQAKGKVGIPALPDAASVVHGALAAVGNPVDAVNGAVATASGVVNSLGDPTQLANAALAAAGTVQAQAQGQVDAATAQAQALTGGVLGGFDLQKDEKWAASMANAAHRMLP